MDSINPLSGSLAQGTLAQRQLGAVKTQQMRLAQQQEKNVAARDDEMEHQVENSEELTPIHEDHTRQDSQRRKDRQQQNIEDDDGKESGLDLTA